MFLFVGQLLYAQILSGIVDTFTQFYDLLILLDRPFFRVDDTLNYRDYVGRILRRLQRFLSGLELHAAGNASSEDPDSSGKILSVPKLGDYISLQRFLNLF